LGSLSASLRMLFLLMSMAFSLSQSSYDALLAIPKTHSVLGLHRALTPDDPHQHHHHCEHEQNVDESVEGKARHQAQCPQQEKNDCYRPKHLGLRSPRRGRRRFGNRVWASNPMRIAP
jgi:hypothetical protein